MNREAIKAELDKAMPGHRYAVMSTSVLQLALDGEPVDVVYRYHRTSNTLEISTRASRNHGSWNYGTWSLVTDQSIIDKWRTTIAICKLKGYL